MRFPDIDHTITAGPETLMRQAAMTAAVYLSEAVKRIDAEFCEGYAQKHPELVGAFLQTCALDYGAAIVSQQLRAGLDAIADRIDSGAGLIAARRVK